MLVWGLDAECVMLYLQGMTHYVRRQPLDIELTVLLGVSYRNAANDAHQAAPSGVLQCVQPHETSGWKLVYPKQKAIPRRALLVFFCFMVSRK